MIHIIKRSEKILISFSLILFFLLLINCSKDIKQKEDFVPVDDPNGLKGYNGFLKIPGVGFQTFMRFEDEDPTIKNLPFSSGSAYFRWMWRKVEPQEGEYDWEFIDHHLARARENGQTLEFRIMLESPGGYEVGIPQWLVDKGVSMRFTHCESDYYSPDLEDPIIKEYHTKLIRALGERYDGHPDLGSVDIGSVGMWGEWHEYCNPELMPGREERSAIIDLYYESFPNTPLVSLVDDKEGLQYAAQKGRSAWRGDCWGNHLPEGTGWNHHHDSYWPAHNLIPEGWKNGPVALESCWTMKKWLSDGGDITQIVNDAISWHATLVHNKSDHVPEEYISEIERLVMKVGFRLALKKISFEQKVDPGSIPAITLEWVNYGIAPPYRDHRIAFRLRNKKDDIHANYISDQSIRGWLPGETSVKIEYPLPGDLSEGEYALELGLVFHIAPDRLVPIANENKRDDGWYVVGKIIVR